MGWYDAFKDALLIAQKADNIDLYQKLLDLQHDMQNMQKENYELKRLVQELRDNNTLKSEMKVSENKMSFYRTHNGESTGPYCPVCWQKDEKLVFLQNGENTISCPICYFEIDLTDPIISLQRYTHFHNQHFNWL